jgi:hypothetical protein
MIMKTIGWITVAALGVGAFLYFGGYVGGKAEVKMTDKGRQALTDSLEATRNGISNGLQKAAESVKNTDVQAPSAQK